MPQQGSPPETGQDGTDWRSSNDERWERAEQLREPKAGGVTSSGLPRRVPKANLVEGAAEQTPQGGPQVSRAPEDVRGRLSNLRRGVQQGRNVGTDPSGVPRMTNRASAPAAPTIRSVSVSPMSQAAQNLNWLITNFVDNTPGVSHTVVVSADGLLLAMSEGFPRDRADQLAAVASGLTSLTSGASRIFEGGSVNQTVVEMERGFLFIMSVSDGSSLAVLAHPECDIGLVGYEMALLVDRAGTVLTPDLRAELQGSLLN
ncbi:hypothetical protein Srufu_022860 [Streptomyces libani subsp. rufus]|nr:hypothetical protein Srufu_022860 [Streptomyces libani subsp. rufus]